MTVKLTCQLIIFALLAGTCHKMLRDDLVGSDDTKPFGLVGVVITVMANSLIGYIFYTAGAFSEFIP